MMKKEAQPESMALKVSSVGVRTAADLSRLASALITDTLSGALSTKHVGAACRASELLVRSAEFQMRYGVGALLVPDEESEGDKPSQVEVRRRQLLEELAQLEKEESCR